MQKTSVRDSGDSSLAKRNLQRGQPLKCVGPSTIGTIPVSTGVELDVPGGRMEFHSKTRNLLRLAISLFYHVAVY